MSNPTSPPFFLEYSKTGEHEQLVVVGTIEIGVIGSKSGSLLLLRPFHHSPNARILVRRYKAPNQTTIAVSTTDSRRAVGRFEGVGLQDIGHAGEESLRL
jgi:hypothetical protein